MAARHMQEFMSQMFVTQTDCVLCAVKAEVEGAGEFRNATNNLLRSQTAAKRVGKSEER